MATSITRRNPHTGRIERPWRNRDGLFVLGDPAHGAQKHHDKFALKVGTIQEVAALVSSGHSVRMTDGESPPSLISPDSLTIEEVDDSDTVPLFIETTPRPPFTKEEMMGELRRAMMVQANQLAHAGDITFATAFMGFETVNPFYPYCEDDPAQVDLSRFSASVYMDKAYDFAFQLDSYWDFGDGTAQDIEEFVCGANPRSSDGSGSPLANPDGMCRRAGDTAFGRWKLKAGLGLSIRELALLGSMKEAAVRNSLSKERIPIDRGEVDPDIAMAWLRQRRDFVPTRTEEGRREGWMARGRALLQHGDFSTGFTSLLRDYPISEAELAAKAAVSPEFIAALLAGRPTPDPAALSSVGNALDLDVPHFAGMAVQAALRMGTAA
jgi:hypothetical protein